MLLLPHLEHLLITTSGRRWLDRLGRLAIVVVAIVLELAIWDGARELRGGGLLPYLVVPVVIVAVHATLLLRWIWPRTIFVLEWFFALVATAALPDFQPFVGLLVALHAVATRLPPRESVVWWGTVLAPLGIQSWVTANDRSDDPGRGFVVFMILWTSLSLVIWGLGRLAYASAERARRLRELERSEAEEALRSERVRLARELHDTVSHAVTGMLLQAAGTRALTAPDDQRIRSALDTIEATGVQAMSELHRLLGLLHASDSGADPDAVPTGPAPTLADLTDLIELARAPDRPITLAQRGSPGDLDPSVATAAYRVAQEGLTNSAKHAGTRAAVMITLDWQTDHLLITVADRRSATDRRLDGVAALSSGRGLLGLRERVTLVGGTLRSTDDRDGFRLVARLPRPVEPDLGSLR